MIKGKMDGRSLEEPGAQDTCGGNEKSPPLEHVIQQPHDLLQALLLTTLIMMPTTPAAARTRLLFSFETLFLRILTPLSEYEILHPGVK